MAISSLCGCPQKPATGHPTTSAVSRVSQVFPLFGYPTMIIFFFIPSITNAYNFPHKTYLKYSSCEESIVNPLIPQCLLVSSINCANHINHLLPISGYITVVVNKAMKSKVGSINSCPLYMMQSENSINDHLVLLLTVDQLFRTCNLLTSWTL